MNTVTKHCDFCGNIMRKYDSGNPLFIYGFRKFRIELKESCVEEISYDICEYCARKMIDALFENREKTQKMIDARHENKEEKNEDIT